MEYDRYCDLTMRGGTTSGVVYPLAVCALAEHYEFKSIGGSSAGAIAAAFTAAAERGRDQGGFAKLAGTIDWFTSGGDADKWRLAQLFQPSERTRALYRIVVATMQRKDTTGRSPVTSLFFALLGAVGLRAKLALALMGALWLGGPVLWTAWLAPREYERWLAIALIVLALATVPLVLLRIRNALPWRAWLVVAIPLVLGLIFARHWATAAVALVVWLVLSFAGVSALIVTYGLAAQRFLRDNSTSIHFGLVPGTGAFTASLLDRLSGVPKSTGVPPLSDWIADQLDDLSGVEVLKFSDLTGINLVLMTTDLSEGRPYRLPWQAPGEWQYCAACLNHVLPDRIVGALDGAELADKCPVHGDALRSLPPNEELPVALAVRMSLSAPGLIAAVPLYRDGQVHWFSDGGITSNFPIHFFDSMLPRWPTFGLSLQGFPDGGGQEVWLPEQDASTSGRRYVRLDSTGSFLGSILSTFLDWRDSMQSALPGYRGRIAHVRQHPDEGGLNLFMAPPTIRRLADRGRLAGQMLHDRFVQREETDRYRWIRLRVAMREYQALGTEAADREALYDELVERFQIPAALHGWFRTPPSGTDPSGPEIENALDQLGGLAAFGPYDGAPPVDPDLRLTPPE